MTESHVSSQLFVLSFITKQLLTIHLHESLLLGISIISRLGKYLQLSNDLTFDWLLDLTPPAASLVGDSASIWESGLEVLKTDYNVVKIKQADYRTWCKEIAWMKNVHLLLWLYSNDKQRSISVLTSPASVPNEPQSLLKTRQSRSVPLKITFTLRLSAADGLQRNTSDVHTHFDTPKTISLYSCKWLNPKFLVQLQLPFMPPKGVTYRLNKCGEFFMLCKPRI